MLNRERLDVARQQARRLPTTAREAAVLYRVGLTPLTRPAEAAAAILTMKRWGLVAGALRIAARRNPEALGLVDDLGELTFRDLDRRSNSLARAWRERGLGEQSVIAVLCRDHRGLLDAMFACGKIGAKLLLMNTGFAKPALAAVAEREGVDTLVYDVEFTSVLGDIAGNTSRYLAWTNSGGAARGDMGYETIEQLIESTDGADVARPEAAGALVLLTSGTTGTPKGAPRHVSSPFAAAQFLERIPLHMGERTVIGAPLFHGTGFSQFVLSLALGSTTITHRKFDPRRVLESLQQYRAETLVLVPTMLQRLLRLGDDVIHGYDTSRLRIVFVAGSALAPEVGNHTMAVFGDVLYNLYGSTEVAVATIATPADWKLAPGTVGRAPVGCTVVLYDDHDNKITEPNVPGRVFVGSGLKFSGYTGGGSKEELDGLLSSGDVGHFDESGLLFIDGRDDDMIVSGGENVFPGEVEDLLLEHDAIDDAAVLGIDDADFGKRLKAYVVVKTGSTLTADAVKAHVKGQLARHKVPRDVVFIDDLPRNATGKLLRAELIDTRSGNAEVVDDTE